MSGDDDDVAMAAAPPVFSTDSGDRSYDVKPFAAHLPAHYAHRIPDEGAQCLAQIKHGLAYCYITRDVARGGKFWCRALRRFLSQKHRLTVEDRTELATLLLRFVFLDNIDTAVQSKYMAQCTKLIKKDRLVLPGLVIPWRPFLALFRKHYHISNRSMRYISKGHESALVSLVHHARRYFAPGATQEIWDELRPRLCPHDSVGYDSQGLLTLFLPTHDPQLCSGWVEEALTVWEWRTNSYFWDTNFMCLFSRVANGARNRVIDWDPYAARLFTHFVRILELPVGPSPNVKPVNSGTGRVQPLGADREVQHMARLIVNMITPTNSVLDRLEQLMRSVESFYHPSNGGAWTKSLAQLLQALCQQMSTRHYRETLAACETPAARRLTPACVDRFLAVFTPVVDLALYSKSKRMADAGAQAVRYMAYMRPAEVLPPILEKVHTALQTLTETHTTRAALDILGVIVFALTDRKLYPEGAAYLPSLLELTLPGIDPNDIVKTATTFKFYAGLLTIVPLVDATKQPLPAGMMLSEADEAARSATARLEDWAVQMLTRSLTVMEHNATPEDARSNKVDTLVDSVVDGVIGRVFHQASEPIYKTLLQRLFNYVSGNFKTSMLSALSKVLGSCAGARPELALAKFVPFLYEHIVTPAGTLQPLSKSELHWYVGLLGALCRRAHVALLPYVDKLDRVVELTILHSDKKVSSAAGNLLRKCMHTVTAVDTHDLRSVPLAVLDSPDFQATHWSTWGPSRLEDIDISWHVPNEAEIAWACGTFRKYFTLCGGIVDEWLASGKVSDPLDAATDRNEVNTNVRSLWNALQVLHSIMVGSRSLLPECEPDDYAANYKPAPGFMQLVRPTHSHGLPLAAPDNPLRGMRERVGELLHTVCTRLLDGQSDNTRLLKAIINITSDMVGVRGYDTQNVSHDVRALTWEKRNMFRVYKEQLTRPRNALVGRIRYLQLSRACEAVWDVPQHAMYHTLFEDLFRLSTYEYSAVRAGAQHAFTRAVRRFPLINRKLLPKVIELLHVDGSTDAQTTGATYLLQGEGVLKKVCSKWSLLASVLMGALRGQWKEKDTVQVRLFSLVHKMLFSAFHTGALTVALPSDDEVAALGGVVGDAALLAEAHASVRKNNERNLATFQQLECDLRTMFETMPNMHWRYQMYATGALMVLMRRDVVPAKETVQLWWRALRSESPQVRSICFKCVSTFLGFFKRRRGRAPAPGPRGRVSAEEWAARDEPRSAEAWAAYDFCDKNWFGWNGWPSDAFVYTPLEERVPSVCEELLAVGHDFLTDAEWVSDVVHKLTSSHAQNVSETNIHFWKGIADTYGEAALEAMLPHMDKLAQSYTETQEQCVAVELIGGMARGVKHWPYEAVARYWAAVGPILKTALTHCTAECVDQWETCVRTCVYDFDLGRVHWLCDLLLPNALAASEDGRADATSSADQAKRLRVIHPILGEFSWRGLRHIQRMIPLLEQNLAHPYHQVRERIGGLLAVSVANLWEPVRDAGGDRVLPLQEVITRDNAMVEELVTHMVERIGHAQREKLIVNEPNNEVTVRETNYCHTVLDWLTNSFSMGIGDAALPHVPRLLRFLFRMQDDSLPKLAGAAKHALVLIARSHLPPAIVRAMLNEIGEHVVTADNWHTRAAALPFLQVLTFRNMSVLDEGEWTTLFAMVEHMLADTQVEVRELASLTLSGMLKCGPAAVVDEVAMRTRFTKAAGTRIPGSGKRRSKKKAEAEAKWTAEDIAKRVVKRHGGVLGLAAHILAHPYSIPEWMPPVLVDVALHVGDRMPISKTVKRVFTEFWRTHQDMWPLFRQQFTPDQLSTLTDLMVAPSYYA